jgi:hypothetical protein
VTVTGGLPTSGVRIAIERPKTGEAPWTYAGEAASAEGALPVTVVVQAAGEVSVDGVTGAVADKVKAIVRTAWKHAIADDPGAAPPWRIVRWRGEK